jgi:hypothetical protein
VGDRRAEALKLKSEQYSKQLHTSPHHTVTTYSVNLICIHMAKKTTVEHNDDSWAATLQHTTTCFKHELHIQSIPIPLNMNFDDN